MANAARLEELKLQHAAYEAELAQWKGVAAKYAGGGGGGGGGGGEEAEEEEGGGEEELDAALLEAHLGTGASAAAAAEAFTMGDALVDVRTRSHSAAKGGLAIPPLYTFSHTTTPNRRSWTTWRGACGRLRGG